ncbi:Rap1 GTPase-activating protein 1 [Amphibalanus amphitrite]|uniref:Rap1 GTPase-activating protein 1 n=1 Tax=Amphibalanus amphitrite TaxID=1232801 RepID=A0A6A4VRE4_AMPAM|nr:Rap1 GTPase-activating protein 1 [Amphibalanus amphitrite]
MFQIYCDLHFADLALMESSDFMNQLRAFKPQSLGCAVARRKSSTTLIFPLPPQACSVNLTISEVCISAFSDEFCRGYPHNLIVTPGYWVECSGQTALDEITWTLGEVEELETFEQHAIEQDDSATPIEEHFEKYGSFELTSIEQETYEKYFYGTEHWNYFTQDEDLGPIILSLKQETINGRDQFRIMVRAISYTVHGLVPASCVFADRYNREEVVRSLGNEINLNPPLLLSQLPDIPEELLKLDQVFIKSELKVGVVYVKEGQYTEEEILDNNESSRQFDEFLSILGERVRLKGFDKYKGGLDTVHDLTGLTSVYTNWRSIDIMFHVSILLPYEKQDIQKLQRKRHIGNDIVCVVFLEADDTCFSPACIKSHFLHTFIVVRTSPNATNKPTQYQVSVVSRDEVGAYKPYLWEQSTFEKGAMFREWLLTKIVNGERASYSAPKFARMQERTRSQMLEDIVTNVQNHAETGQLPKPYRRGSWRPIGHMRPSSPLLDSVRDLFEGYDQLAKDFTKAFHNPEQENPLYDVTFLVGQSKQKMKIVFQEMLYGFSTGFGSPQVSVADILARAVPTLHSPSHRGKSSNFLQVPDIESPRPKSVPSSPMVVRAFSRLGSITAGWGRTSKKPPDTSRLRPDDRKKWASSHDCSADRVKPEKQGDAQDMVPKLSVCADQQKVDRSKLCQNEFTIIEFEPDTFRVLLDYLHHGSCPLTCSSVPGLICAAEHYDLPELLQACFHHAKQFLRVDVVCTMLGALENYYWRYTSASELVNMILAFIESRPGQVFQTAGFLDLSESMVQMIMCRHLDMSELHKFEVMLRWTRHKVRSRPAASRADARLEFRRSMERLARDVKLYRISPQELIRVVLPSKAISNERILETLMLQANSGMYRVQESDLEACQRSISRQGSRLSSEWDSFDNGL